MITSQKCVSAILILVSLVLAECGVTPPLPDAPATGPCDADFGNVMPQGWALISKIALETDNDGTSECVVFYRLGAQQDTQKIAPVEGVVYRQDHGGPPRWVYPCFLRPPSRFYLGEHQISARVEPVLSGLDQPVLIVEDKDPEGNIVEASLFVWQDKKKDQPDAPPDPKEMFYQAAGWFMAEGGVTVEHDRVIVNDRIPGTRSRLANRKLYLPFENKTYYKDGDPSKLAEPEVSVVSLIECNDPEVVCYPEKIVLNFYTYVPNDDRLNGLLQEAALKDWQAGKLKYGCPPDLAQLARVIIQDLKIQGSDDKPEIVVTGACKFKDGSTKPMDKVTWKLEKNNQGKWRIKSSK